MGIFYFVGGWRFEYLCSYKKTMKRLFYIIIALVSGTVAMQAGETGQDHESKKAKFVYDVNFEMNFDNREFYESNFSSSMTIFGARLTPAVGLELATENNTSHRLMFGVDVMKDFGASPISESIAGGQTAETKTGLNNKELFREISLYYRLNKKFNDTEMTLYAGIFPRRNMEGKYSQAFFSDSLKFYDNNLEGLLVKFKRANAYYEVGCDWMGQYGENRRERFMIYSSGEGKVASFLTLGYSGYMYHFANSEKVKALVDNILLNPYARLDFGKQTGFQTLSVTLGYLQALQHNRVQVGHYVFPGGVHLDFEVRKWDVAIKNMAYYGYGIMPYYNYHDPGDIKFGNNLYLGDPFYRVYDIDSKERGLYDRFEVCYEPVVGKHLKIRVAALLHFNNFRYSGFQQNVGIVLQL